MNEVISLDDARAVLNQEQQARVDACRKEIETALEKHNCSLDIFVVLRRGSIEPNLQIVAKPNDKQ